jgi:hypothetical protein
VGGVRQFGRRAEALGEGTVTRKRDEADGKAFARVVGRALRRAGVTARKTARAHGTPIYVWRNGKVVAEKP